MAEENLNNIEEGVSKLESAFEENKSKIIGGVAVLAVVVVGIWAYNNFIVKPKEAKAKEAIWKAEYALLNNSDYEQAIYGDSLSTYVGLKNYVEEYGSTEAGNLANYYLGVSYLNLGEYQKAIDAFADFSSDDEILSSIAIGATGDALLELNKTKEAVEKYVAAANNSDNNLTGAIYLKKAGFAYEMLGDNAKALEMYEQIKDKYPTSSEARQISKDIARLK